MALYRVSDQFFVFAPTVGIRAVEKVDADLARAAQGVDRGISVGLIVERRHRRATETDRGNLQSTEPAPLHSFLLNRSNQNCALFDAADKQGNLHEKGKI